MSRLASERCYSATPILMNNIGGNILAQRPFKVYFSHQIDMAMTRKGTAALLFSLLFPVLAFAQTEQATAEADRAGIHAAVLDYVEALYNVEPERIERSVHPNLTKYGYWMPRDGNEYKGGAMTFEQLVDLAGRWNVDDRQQVADAPREIVIFDVMDKTAVAKLSAKWGVDHMQLAKVDGKWMIMNILWQSYPPQM